MLAAGSHNAFGNDDVHLRTDDWPRPIMTNIKLCYFKHLVSVTDRSHQVLWNRMTRWLNRRRSEQYYYGSRGH
eukprot:12406599-Karenia_brevis.AAC.1